MHCPWQSFRAFLFLHRSVEADARRLVRTGAPHAAAPVMPMLRSNSRREIRLDSIVHLRLVWMAGSRYVRVGSSATALIAQCGAAIRTASNPWRRIRRVKLPPSKPLEDAEAEIRAALARIPARIRRQLLEAIMLPQAERADL